MSYKNLEIWVLAKELSIDIHAMTMNLPLGKKLNNFLKAIQQSHQKPGEVNEPLAGLYIPEF